MDRFVQEAPSSIVGSRYSFVDGLPGLGCQESKVILDQFLLQSVIGLRHRRFFAYFGGSATLGMRNPCWLPVCPAE